MVDYKGSVLIDLPPDKVFKAFTDPSLYDQWTDMSNTRLVKGQRIEPGAQLATVIHMGPMEVPLTFEVAELVPDKKLKWKTISDGDMHWDAEYLLEAQNGGTRVTTSGRLRFTGDMAEAEAEMAGEIGEAEQKELERFKKLVESANKA